MFVKWIKCWPFFRLSSQNQSSFSKLLIFILFFFDCLLLHYNNQLPDLFVSNHKNPIAICFAHKQEFVMNFKEDTTDELQTRISQ